MTPDPAIGRDAFAELYRRTSADVLAYLVRRVPVREDAADLLAEVYLTAWRRRAVLPRAPEDRLWLFGIARRLLLAHHRLESRRDALAGELRAALARLPQEPEHEPDRRGPHDERRVHAVLATLSDLDREMLTLTVWDGLTPAEAGRVLGLRPGHARVRLHRARARLGRRLASDGVRLAASGRTPRASETPAITPLGD